MSRSQWRRFQRRRKAEKEAAAEPHPESSTNVQRKGKGNQRKPLKREPIAGRLVFPEQCGSKDEGNSDSDDTLDIMVNVISVLPREYNRQVEVEEIDLMVE